jgi:hypothetical protein
VSYASTVLGPLVVIGAVQINIDPTTGLPVIGGDTRVTTFNSLATSDPRVTQTTGEPPGGLNQLPGTNPNAPGNDDPGLPYNFDEVPRTGTLTSAYVIATWYNDAGEEVGWIDSSGSPSEWIG